jgi:hypothetical protein
MVAIALDNIKDEDISGNTRMGIEVGYLSPWSAK